MNLSLESICSNLTSEAISRYFKYTIQLLPPSRPVRDLVGVVDMFINRIGGGGERRERLEDIKFCNGDFLEDFDIEVSGVSYSVLHVVEG